MCYTFLSCASIIRSELLPIIMPEKSEILEIVMLGRADLNTYGSEYITGAR